jgi:hypothetical protein
MITILLLAGLVVFFASIWLVIPLARGYATARGPRVIVCPETKTSEVVAVDAPRAAWSALRRQTDYRLASCSRWPGRQDCGMECLAEIESAPDGCLVRERLTHWYEGSVCAICRKPFEEIHWFDHKPGLVTRKREVSSWDEVPAKELPEILRTRLPLCWNCLGAETFRTRFPDLVLYDPRPAPRPDSGRRAGTA